MMKKILCATDGSEHAEKAVSLASDLAARYGAELVLMHVLMEGAGSEDLQRFTEVEGLAGSVKRELERIVELQRAVLAASAPVGQRGVSPELLQRIGDHVLQQAASEAKGKGVSQVSTRTERGDAAKCIVRGAEEVGADTIVIGSRGLSDFKGFFLGSISHSVSSRANCTCITVK